MAWSLIRRLGPTLLGVWILASLIFIVSRLGPIADDKLGLGEVSDLSASHTAAANTRQLMRQATRQRLGLAMPLFYFSRTPHEPAHPRGQWHWHGSTNQYHYWVVALLKGDLGISFRDGQPVSGRLVAALRYTLPLTGTAVVVAGMLALVLAQQLALRPWWRTPALALLASLHALPLFVLAAGMLLLLANPEALNWFPTYPQIQENTVPMIFGTYSILPLACLVISAFPELTLQLEASLCQELRAGYVATARAKGVGPARVVRHHALRNALLPVLTLFTDLLPALVAGTVVVEVIFALPGMGRLLAEAATARDYPVLVGGVLLVGAIRLLTILLAELLYLGVDPRLSA